MHLSFLFFNSFCLFCFLFLLFHSFTFSLFPFLFRFYKVPFMSHLFLHFDSLFLLSLYTFKVVLPYGPYAQFRFIWGPFLSVLVFKLYNKVTVFSGVRSSYTHSPLTWIIGAFAHAPKHSTYWIVNNPSLVVYPDLIPKCF